MLVSQSYLELNHSVLISRFVHCACGNMYRLAEKVGQGVWVGLLTKYIGADGRASLQLSTWLDKHLLYVSEGVQLWCT